LKPSLLKSVKSTKAKILAAAFAEACNSYFPRRALSTTRPPIRSASAELPVDPSISGTAVASRAVDAPSRSATTQKTFIIFLQQKTIFGIVTWGAAQYNH
jgi:hypothetical protein